MRLLDAVALLNAWDKKGRCVFTRADLRLVFRDDADQAFNATLKGLVKHEQLVRAAHGVYVFPHGRTAAQGRLLEQVVIALRRGEYSYLSLESLLSAHGAISQIPMVMTVMTTGRRGRYDTPFGSVEFTHTKRSRLDILDATVRQQGNPLRLASPATAFRDLVRVGRNVAMVDREVLCEG